MESEPINQEPKRIETKQGKGCSGLAALIVLSFWIIFVTIIIQIVNWLIIQMVFEGSIGTPIFVDY